MSTGTGDGAMTDRRTLATGLLALGALAAGPGLAQTAEGQPPGAIDEAALLANLFTRMSIKTTINGGASRDFVLDTGAGRSAIAEDLAVALGLPPGPSVLVHGVTSAEVARTVKMTRLGFGGRRFTDVYPAVFPRALLAADGLLGLDVLSQFQVEFDMERRTLLLNPSGPDVFEWSTAFTTPSRLNRNDNGRTRTGRFGQLILLNAHADEVPVQCFVDSGAQFSIGNMALHRALGGREGALQRTLVQVYGVTGQTLLAEPGAVRQLEINRQRLGPNALLFADLHAFGALDLIDQPSLLLGADILYRFRKVSLDFGRSRMSFSGLRRPRTLPTRS